MRKFIIAKTGEEVHIGDAIQRIEESKNSFGTIKTIETTTITFNNIGRFIDDGIIKVVDTEDSPKKTRRCAKYVEGNIGRYIVQLASKLGCSINDLINWFNAMNKVYPKAVLDMLLHTIASKFYEEDPEAFNNAKEYYSLRPKDGKVGKVPNITHKYISLFKSVEDAEKARTILKEQLELMYGKQEDN